MINQLKYCIILWILCLFTSVSAEVECDFYFNKALSNRIANYEISLVLDHTIHSILADQQLEWVNSSPDTIYELRFYMYLNAFKNTESTFLKGSGRSVFGDDLYARSKEEWGWIKMNHISTPTGVDLIDSAKYIQPDDGNIEDESVLSVLLDTPLLPGENIQININFEAKLPKTIVRSGYSKDDFHLWVHWFPQIGVYEMDINGDWGWNCHQFFRNTEFYADFGVYDVHIRLADHFVVGASGCLVAEQQHEDGTKTLSFHAEDVIDFAWTAYPRFEEYLDSWQDVSIRLLIPPEHCKLAPRYITAVKQALEYLNDHVGKYPFPVITMMDPPLHGLRSGMMEYPTFITGGSFYGIPKNIRSLEALVMHEFAHQYFMMMLASNEKEEAWLDEGFVTYFEDRILDYYYGEKSSYYNILGYKTGNAEMSRLEYTGMSNHRVGIIASPGWEVLEGRKELFYSKTATMLKTLEGLVGEGVMDKIIQSYFEKWKFKHPRGNDFLETAISTIQTELGQQKAEIINSCLEQILYTPAVCDYEVASISNYNAISGHGLYGEIGSDFEFKQSVRHEGFHSSVKIYRRGDMVIPVEIEFIFNDGNKIIEQWSGEEYIKIYSFKTASQLISAHIDPAKKVYLDIDFNNNSKTIKPKRTALYKYASKAMHWVQNTLQIVSLWL